MDCKTFSSMIYEYLDDTLSENDKMDFLAHLEQCKNCKEELEQAQEIQTALRESAADTPDFITPAIHKIIQKRKLRRRQIAAFTSAAAMLLVSSLFLWQPKVQNKMSDEKCAANGEAETFQSASDYSKDDLSLGETALEAAPEEKSESEEPCSKSASHVETEILVLNQEQSSKLYALLSDELKMRLTPEEGGSYLQMQGIEEELLPILEQCDIMVDLQSYQIIFLTEISQEAAQ